jgi:hypothetical protein
MRQWYRGLGLLPGGIEHVIPAEYSLEETAGKIMADAGLGTPHRAARPPVGSASA